MYEHILYEVEDPIAKIVLNRPERLNAWTNQMGDEVKHAVAQAEADSSVVAIVLTGAGRGFCAGADLQDLQSLGDGKGAAAGAEGLDAEPGDEALEDFRGTYTYLMSVRKPTIAAINGPCAGMAVPISLACDLRYAAESAVFTTAFSQRGLIAEWGIAWMLPRLVGTGNALDLLFSARKFDGAEAERIGMVNRVLPDAELMPFVEAYVRDLAAHCSPASLQVMKRQVYEQWTRSLGPSEREAIELMLESFDRPDFKEGVDSFLAKRPPKFGRL